MSQPYKRKKPTLLVNDQIKAPTMLVLDDDGEQLGKMPRRKALELGQTRGLDIIQMHYDFREKIATVKLVDLGKYLYEQQKAKKEKKKKQQKKGLKQLKFGYSIGDNDLQLKVKKSQEFLEDGHDVKITVRLRGREHIYAERVYEKLLAIMDYLSEWSRPQYPRPKKEAHGYSIILMPKS